MPRPSVDIKLRLKSRQIQGRKREKLARTYANQKLTIDGEKSIGADRNVQIVYLRQECLFGQVPLSIFVGPECEFFDVSDQFDFLKIYANAANHLTCPTKKPLPIT